MTLLPHTALAKEELHVALRRLDDCRIYPTLPDGTSPEARCPAAMAVAACATLRDAPPPQQRQGSTFFLVWIRVALAVVMVRITRP